MSRQKSHFDAADLEGIVAAAGRGDSGGRGVPGGGMVGSDSDYQKMQVVASPDHDRRPRLCDIQRHLDMGLLPLGEGLPVVCRLSCLSAMSIRCHPVLHGVEGSAWARNLGVPLSNLRLLCGRGCVVY